MREFWVAIGLLWLAGASLRLTVLAVPPVIALIQADLDLSGTE
ncbi:MAG: MFS transporter, partial [Xanthobacteraceae bacterium]